jgi:hypothetical protein
MDHYFGRIDSEFNRAYDADYVQITFRRFCREASAVPGESAVVSSNHISSGKVSHAV